jgi:hypothetical protein
MLETSAWLHIAQCRICGITFAVENGTYCEAMREKTPLCCPIGHKPAIIWSDADPLELAAINLELMAKLKEEKFLTVQLRHRLCSVQSPTEAITDQRELRRRSEILSRRAERDSHGREICKFCGRSKGSLLAPHLRKAHRDALAKMPADLFL